MRIDFKNQFRDIPSQFILTDFVMHWPGKIESSAKTDLLFSALDIMPAILGLMDLEVPEECQGKNLAESILTGDENAVEYVPIWSFYNNSFKGVITKDWTCSTVKDASEGSIHSVLFDRRKDPFQLTNLFESLALQAEKDSLWELTNEWMKQYDDRFYTSEDLEQVMSDEEWDLNRSQLPVDLLKSEVKTVNVRAKVKS